LAGDDNRDVIGAAARQPEDGSAIERQTASGASIGLIQDTRDNAIDAPRSAGDRRRRGWTPARRARRRALSGARLAYGEVEDHCLSV